MALEEERKYDVGSSFKLPGLSPLVAKVVPRPLVTLTATYYDTEDLRLIRAGASLRYRSGDDLPWTVKLGTGMAGVRQEISMPGKPRAIPADLVWLVASLTRGAKLAPVAVVRSRRRRYDLCDAAGVVLAELADDRVSTPTRSFRELEVERKDGPGELLSTVERELIRAGAAPSAYPSKLARVLDVTDSGPDIHPDVRRLLDHDPLVRLGELLPNGDTPVHQMRVAIRRLRSNPRQPARRELRWLAGLLGAARDMEVLRARLRRTADADSLAPIDPTMIEPIDSVLRMRHDNALAALSAGMRGARYAQLLDRLVTTPVAKRRKVPPPQLELTEPAQDAPDALWHRLRIEVKRARYTAEAAGDRRDPLPRLLARIQDLLGEHQDAAVAAQTWLDFGTDPALAVTAGRLYERERGAIRITRAALPALWRELEPLRTAR